MSLSEKQEQIVNAKGKVVVKACPGSGKTYSVSARISKLLEEKSFHHQGIATISFTNTARDEINEKLVSDFKVSTPLPYPHFVGTIDSFLNKFILLPYGHLIMNTKGRPSLVGEPHTPWSGRTYLESFFEKISIDLHGNFFSKKGSLIPKKMLNNACKVKHNLLKNGILTQSDANYFSLEVLKQYPLITKNIIKRFPYVIMDEAQDTNDIQMAIIDELVKNGLEEIMLIGDPNQAIYEWNNANPKLFLDKYEKWKSISLDENRRSSSAICNSSNEFIGEDVSKPCQDNPDMDFKYIPKIVSCDVKNNKDVESLIESFLQECVEHGIEITKKNVAILYRSKSLSNLFSASVDFKDSPWKTNFFHLRDIVKGKYLFDQGNQREGFKLIEQGYLRGRKGVSHIKRNEIQSIVEQIGYVKYREMIHSFITSLPNTLDDTLDNWIKKSKTLLSEHSIPIDYTINKSKVLIGMLFLDKIVDDKSYYWGTIHSSKGCTFQAVLLLLTKKGGNTNYSTLLSKGIESLSPQQQEELRIIYVGMTRPRKILNIGVPSDDMKLWNDKLKISEDCLQENVF